MTKVHFFTKAVPCKFLSGTFSRNGRSLYYHFTLRGHNFTSASCKVLKPRCQIKAPWLHFLLVSISQTDQSDTLLPFYQGGSHMSLAAWSMCMDTSCHSKELDDPLATRLQDKLYPRQGKRLAPMTLVADVFLMTR